LTHERNAARQSATEQPTRVEQNRKEKAAMATQTADAAVEQQIQKLRDTYADAPEIGRTLEKISNTKNHQPLWLGGCHVVRQ
jgi:hypothetical protein